MESIFEKYIEDIRSLLPLHRIFLFAIFAVISVVSHNELSRPFSTTMLALSADAKGLTRLSEGAIVGDYVLAGMLVVATWVLYRMFARWLVQRVWRSLSIDASLALQYEAFDRLSLDPELRVAALDFAQKEARQRAVIPKARAVISELCLGLGLCLTAYSSYGHYVDLLVGLGLLVLGAWFQVLSFLYYLRHVLPYELNASALSGLGIRLGMPR